MSDTEVVEPLAVGTVPNVAPDQPITSSWGNTVADTVNALSSPPTVKCGNSAPFSHASSGAWAAVTWPTETYDASGMHDPAVNPTRLTVAVAGKYAISPQLSWDSNTSGLRAVAVRKNNTTDLLIVGFLAAGVGVFAGAIWQNAYVEDAFVAGDYVEIRAFQDSGATRTLTAAVTMTYIGK